MSEPHATFIRHHFIHPLDDHAERDDLLLSLGLTLVCLADGGLDEEEEALLENYRHVLPDWRMLDRSAAFRDALEAQMQAIFDRYTQAHDGDLDPLDLALSVCDELAGIQSPLMRKRCFLLAVDVAMAAGGITDAEDAVLKRMAEVLALDPQTVTTIAQVMAIKYVA